MLWLLPVLVTAEAERSGTTARHWSVASTNPRTSRQSHSPSKTSNKPTPTTCPVCFAIDSACRNASLSVLYPARLPTRSSPPSGCWTQSLYRFVISLSPVRGGTQGEAPEAISGGRSAGKGQSPNGASTSNTRPRSSVSQCTIRPSRFTIT